RDDNRPQNYRTHGLFRSRLLNQALQGGHKRAAPHHEIVKLRQRSDLLLRFDDGWSDVGSSNPKALHERAFFALFSASDQRPVGHDDDRENEDEGSCSYQHKRTFIIQVSPTACPEPGYATTFTYSNISAGSRIPEAASRSAHLGRMPVARKRPQTMPSGRTPVLSKTNRSCIVMTSPSIPVISLMAVTFRVPSVMRAIWTTISIAEAICCRTALSGMFRFAIATMVSKR